jgi:hypothetical protein
MSTAPLRVTMSVLLLAVAQIASAADDYKIIKLEQDVRKLEQQVRDLSRQLSELRRDAGRAADQVPSPVGRETPPTSDSPPWLQSKNWQRLQVGMNELQVIEILGPPTSMRGAAGSDARTLFYALEIGTGNFLGGSVELRERRVVQVRLPELR